MAKKILAVIPAYNEAAHIEKVVRLAAQYLPVLVVDDGSRDQTAALAKNCGAEVWVQNPNQGKGAALKAGFRWAIENNYDAVVTLDADGQHDPDEIPLFLGAFESCDCDLVIGTRDYSKMPIVRRTSNTIGRWAFSRALGRYVADNQSGYRLVSRRLAAVMVESSEAGFELEVEMITECVRRGWGSTDVPISTIYADEKSHIKPLHHIINFFRVVDQTRRKMQQ